MIRDPESGWVEASITINGVLLTFAEAMTVRVAVSSFAMYVAHPENREELGAIADGYRQHLTTVMDKLVPS
jgi:hypothetical protein